MSSSSGSVPAADDGILQYVASSQLPTPWAVFRIHAFSESVSGKEHVALTLGEPFGDAPVLARIHSECLTGDALFSQRCDCGAQLEAALQRIAEEGRGIIMYLRQEGRGIGLLNKIRAYQLQDQGADTVEANERLGFPADMRRYDLCLPMLDHFGIRSVRLMTNNPRKESVLTDLGITVAEHIPLQVNRNPYNEQYLRTKARKLGHRFKEYFGEAP
ncbi:MAG: GTP cyclohydrolase II [Castellaniella sp.]|uniref:GTP cyclohydrolase II n=1 Tax=Castellaniella sp. TaxID=1955812 RepID=UPI003A877D26